MDNKERITLVKKQTKRRDSLYFFRIYKRYKRKLPEDIVDAICVMLIPELTNSNAKKTLIIKYMHPNAIALVCYKQPQEYMYSLYQKWSKQKEGEYTVLLIDGKSEVYINNDSIDRLLERTTITHYQNVNIFVISDIIVDI